MSLKIPSATDFFKQEDIVDLLQDMEGEIDELDQTIKETLQTYSGQCENFPFYTRPNQSRWGYVAQEFDNASAINETLCRFQGDLDKIDECRVEPGSDTQYKEQIAKLKKRIKPLLLECDSLQGIFNHAKQEFRYEKNPLTDFDSESDSDSDDFPVRSASPSEFESEQEEECEPKIPTCGEKVASRLDQVGKNLQTYGTRICRFVEKNKYWFAATAVLILTNIFTLGKYHASERQGAFYRDYYLKHQH